jgi:hypothetical protein
MGAAGSAGAAQNHGSSGLAGVRTSCARIGEFASPTDYRTTRQNEALAILAAAQARRECSRSASTLGVGQHAARNKPLFGGTQPTAISGGLTCKTAPATGIGASAPLSQLRKSGHQVGLVGRELLVGNGPRFTKCDQLGDLVSGAQRSRGCP